MNIPFSQFFNYLLKPNSHVDIRYKEERFSGDIEVIKFLSNDQSNELDTEDKNAYNSFMHDITSQVRDQIRLSNKYRFVAIIFLLFAVLGLSMVLYFSSGNSLVLFGGAYYSFFAYLIIEAYIQANRNYFENQLYKKFNENYLHQ